MNAEDIYLIWRDEHLEDLKIDYIELNEDDFYKYCRDEYNKCED
jgi:hypothetical protein